ncbi:flavin reductase family protein [Trujillonella endophytica]|uniref:NADH-FMN oxidoreductase RutF, flavin reductase (DIM6/NTAB) family n=1 Tax=Trujillonella endophytica TaxID=673521 RepID=A0A1H8UF17_9ACTN|nr:flavin reductase family protein [Trujillella endophytica]SEP01483.1 NADH-FMN oxidoreductase RutF, flavin reductase (DIM6/NTAB) family [Trujillella endophytica]
MKTIDLGGRSPAQLQGLLSQLVVPRPIAMITTIGPAGLNVAPFSYFMPVCGQPPTIAVTVGTVREATPEPKDTWVNLEATGEFVVNLTTTAMADHIETVGREYPAGVDEAALVGWTTRPSEVIAAPSLAESPAHLECRVLETIDRGDPASCFSGVHIVLAEVVNIRVSEDLLASGGTGGGEARIDPTRVEAIGRMGFPYFVAATGDAVFEQVRVPYADLVESTG